MNWWCHHQYIRLHPQPHSTHTKSNVKHRNKKSCPKMLMPVNKGMKSICLQSIIVKFYNTVDKHQEVGLHVRQSVAPLVEPLDADTKLMEPLRRIQFPPQNFWTTTKKETFDIQNKTTFQQRLGLCIIVPRWYERMSRTCLFPSVHFKEQPVNI